MLSIQKVFAIIALDQQMSGPFKSIFAVLGIRQINKHTHFWMGDCKTDTRHIVNQIEGLDFILTESVNPFFGYHWDADPSESVSS